jgi:hypothetical protein
MSGLILGIAAAPRGVGFALQQLVVHNPGAAEGTKPVSGALPRRRPQQAATSWGFGPACRDEFELAATPWTDHTGVARRHQHQNSTTDRSVTYMATDYDAPRKTDDELGEDSIEELKARRVDKTSSAVDEDEIEAAEGFELPGADLSNEELSVRVLPRQADEFTCSRCFLVHHRSQLAKEVGGQPVCRECAA